MQREPQFHQGRAWGWLSIVCGWTRPRGAHALCCNIGACCASGAATAGDTTGVGGGSSASTFS
jgi:hypothetical protein